MNWIKKTSAFISAFFATLFLASIVDDAGGVINPLPTNTSDSDKE